MLRSKYFWIGVVILVPFIVVWIMYGFAWALGMLGMIGVVFLLILGGGRRRRRHVYHIYEDEYDGDEDKEDVVVMERRPQKRSNSSEWVRDLYFPKGLRNIHQDGLNELGRRQRDDLNKSLRRLRRLG